MNKETAPEKERIERCCETCGNMACLYQIVAVLYDRCLQGGYCFWVDRREISNK